MRALNPRIAGVRVRIRVKAVALNPIDVKIRSGLLDGFFPARFPVLPGWDVDKVADTSGAGLLADAIALAGDPADVMTIADDSAAGLGVRFTGQDPSDRMPQALPELAALLAGGRLTVPVWRSYPLAEAAEAQADLEAGRNRGKIILLPCGQPPARAIHVTELALAGPQAWGRPESQSPGQAGPRGRAR